MLVRAKEVGDFQSSALRTHFSIIKELNKLSKVSEMWIVEQGGNTPEMDTKKNGVYCAFDFNDGLEVIDKLKPDLVLVSGDYEFLSRSVLVAARYRGIPTVALFSMGFDFTYYEKLQFVRVLRARIYSLRIRGPVIVKKYLFLLRTMKRSGHSWWSLAFTIIRELYLSANIFEPMYRFGGGDLHLVNAPTAKELLVKNGIEEEKILVTGDCGMDYLFEKLQAQNRRQIGLTRKRILFITDPLVEHGYWTETQRKIVITGIVKTILNLGSDIDLIIKIHPTSESIQSYRDILDTVNSSIEILQKEDVVSLIDGADMIIALGHTSALFPAVILFKPLIIMNLLNEDMSSNIFLNSNLATECKVLDELPKIIVQNKYKKPLKDQVDAFVERTIFRFDGKCSERAANSIFSLINKKP